MEGRPVSLDGIGGMVANSQKTQAEQLSKESNQKIVELESVTKSNVAACYLKLHDYKKALENANKVNILWLHEWISIALICIKFSKAINFNQSNWKAYLRKGEAQALAKVSLLQSS